MLVKLYSGLIDVETAPAAVLLDAACVNSSVMSRGITDCETIRVVEARIWLFDSIRKSGHSQPAAPSTKYKEERRRFKEGEGQKLMRGCGGEWRCPGGLRKPTEQRDLKAGSGLQMSNIYVPQALS
jgi:hypothetical protein